MGLHTQVKTALRQNKKTAKALLKAMPVLHRYVVIEDILTRLHKLLGPRFDGMFTGDELFSAMFSEVLQKLQAQCEAYVFCCDIAVNIPWRKFEEQADRKEAAEKSADRKPYVGSYEIVDAGLRNKDTGRTETINIHRLAATRPLREAMCLYFVGRLQRQALPPNRLIVMDFHAAAPIAFLNGKCFALWHCRHKLGEADMMAPYWTRVLSEGTGLMYPQQEEEEQQQKPVDVLIETVDSDFIPILANYLATTGNKSRVFLSFGNDRTKAGKAEKAKEIWDMQLLTRVITGDLGIPVRKFVLACVACGTDFTDKNTLTRGTGAQKVIEALLNGGDNGDDYYTSNSVLEEAGEQVFVPPPVPSGKAEFKQESKRYMEGIPPHLREKQTQASMLRFTETSKTVPSGGASKNRSSNRPVARVDDPLMHQYVSDYAFKYLRSRPSRKDTIVANWNVAYWTPDWSKVPTRMSAATVEADQKLSDAIVAAASA